MLIWCLAAGGKWVEQLAALVEIYLCVGGLFCQERLWLELQASQDSCLGHVGGAVVVTALVLSTVELRYARLCLQLDKLVRGFGVSEVG